MRQRGGLEKYLLLCLALTGLPNPSVADGPDGPQPTAVQPDTGVTTPGSKVAIHGSAFSPDTIVYFGGLQARETNFMNPSTLEAVTPYLRPGPYRIQIKSAGITVRSEVTFTALPSQVDLEIDRAAAIAAQGQGSAAISILSAIAENNSDYQVRSFAHYQAAQIYFALGDWWRWGGHAAQIFAEESGMAVQTSWRYRLAADQSDYLLDVHTQPDYDLRNADYMVEKDVTQNPEPRFFRGLLNARHGNLPKAKLDSDFTLNVDPSNSSYRALAAYIAVLARFTDKRIAAIADWAKKAKAGWPTGLKSPRFI